LHQILWSLTILQIANYILPLITLPFLIRTLGPDKFGLVMFAQSLAAFLIIVVDFGFTLSGTREVSIYRSDRDKLSHIFSAIMTVKLILIVTCIILLYLIVELIPRFKEDAFVYYLSFGTVIGHAIFPVWFFQGIEKMKFVTGINILAKIIFTLLIFIVIRKESDYILVPAFNSIGFIIAGLLGFILSLKHIKLVRPNIEFLKRLVSENVSLFLAKLATNLYTTCNVLILGLFAGNTIVGVYASMEKLIIAVKNSYSPLYQSLFPWLSKQLPAKRIVVLKKIAPFIFGAGTIITTLIFIFGEHILTLIYNNELITSYTSVFRILSLIAIFAGLNMMFTNLYFPSVKMYKTRMYIFIIGGLFNLILSIILVKMYGIYGMASAVTLTECFLLVLGIYYFNKYSNT